MTPQPDQGFNLGQTNDIRTILPGSTNWKKRSLAYGT
jgi:hypothetical protein